MPTTSETLIGPREVEAILESIDRATNTLKFETKRHPISAHHFDPAALELVKSNLKGALDRVTEIVNRESGHKKSVH